MLTQLAGSQEAGHLLNRHDSGVSSLRCHKLPLKSGNYEAGDQRHQRVYIDDDRTDVPVTRLGSVISEQELLALRADIRSDLADSMNIVNAVGMPIHMTQGLHEDFAFPCQEDQLTFDAMDEDEDGDDEDGKALS